MGSKGAGGSEAQKYVWEGAIPLQIHLHESEVTTLPSPPPALVLSFSIFALFYYYTKYSCAWVWFLMNQIFESVIGINSVSF